MQPLTVLNDRASAAEFRSRTSDVPAVGTLSASLSETSILGWLLEQDEHRLQGLYEAADRVRRDTVGDAVRLRGLVEISSHCARQCMYCGLRAERTQLSRYRMSAGEILNCARQAVEFGYGTLVLQAGEDYGLRKNCVAETIRRIRAETPLAVTLSLGERPIGDLAAWREAGADRYLLRFETSDARLYTRIHPSLGASPSDRVNLLRSLRRLGYEIGSGVMIGIPGQTYATLARDIDLFRELDLDMIGVGPFIPHPQTPLGAGMTIGAADDCWPGSSRPILPHDQVPPTEDMTYRTVALTRLVCPEANIPGTTAVATINRKSGRELCLRRGANVVMPNLTPLHYRSLYEIYPAKACISETARQCHACLKSRIQAIGRTIDTGPDGRHRRG